MKTWHKIAIAVIVVVGIAVCVKSCVDKKEPDLTMAYIGKQFVNRDVYEENVKDLYGACKDITGDGEISIDIMEISYNDELSHADKSNANQKMTNAIGNGAARVYFIEKEYVEKNLEVGVFEDLTDFDVSGGKAVRDSSGKVVAIGVEGNKKVRALGIEPTDELYVAIRKITEMDEFWVKDVKTQNESARNVVKYILED